MTQILPTTIEDTTTTHIATTTDNTTTTDAAESTLSTRLAEIRSMRFDPGAIDFTEAVASLDTDKPLIRLRSQPNGAWVSGFP